MDKPTLIILDQEFSIHRFQPSASLPASIFNSQFYWLGKTDEELSVVCDSSIELNSDQKSEGWSCIKVLGPLDLSMTGVLAGISAVLAAAQISIFALSTFDTDFILVKTTLVEKAVIALREAGYNLE
ncbi:MAG: ACT domain-containing protein [Chloroflexi bacterium]|nr:MAG: ACT domain-containing protein [Chloroflexota bacterium]MBL1192933.1 ACT domain-containing protein [Chloroflexota bacterium]NOH10225.1 ACT domain-containing protein [Chloroflexota bacterium]